MKQSIRLVQSETFHHSAVMWKSICITILFAALASGCATAPRGQFAEGIPPLRDFETVSARSAPSVLAATRDVGGGIYFGADDSFHYLSIVVAERGTFFQDTEKPGWQLGEAGVRERYIRIPKRGLTAIQPLTIGDPEAAWQHFRDWRMIFDDPAR